MLSSASAGPAPDRRRVIVAAATTAAGATALLSGCSAYGGQDAAPAPATDAPAAGGAAASGSSAGGSSAAGGAAAGGAALAALADVPVGGGTVLKAAKLVLTQPTAGTVKAFSAVCTHAGCLVSEVTGGTINCPCHGSRFAGADGSVTAGPAPSPLAAVAVTVKDGKVVRA